MGNRDSEGSLRAAHQHGGSDHRIPAGIHAGNHRQHRTDGVRCEENRRQRESERYHSPWIPHDHTDRHAVRCRASHTGTAGAAVALSAAGGERRQCNTLPAGTCAGIHLPRAGDDDDRNPAGTDEAELAGHQSGHRHRHQNHHHLDPRWNQQHQYRRRGNWHTVRVSYCSNAGLSVRQKIHRRKDSCQTDSRQAGVIGHCDGYDRVRRI